METGCAARLALLTAGVLGLAGCQHAYRPPAGLSTVAEKPIDFGSPACQAAAALGPEKAMKPDDILAALRPFARPKSEFESIADYGKIYSSAISKISEASKALTGQDFLLIAFPIEYSTLKYDAETKIMTTKAPSTLLHTEKGEPSDKSDAVEYIVVSSEGKMTSHKERDHYDRILTVREYDYKQIGVIVPADATGSWPGFIPSGSNRKKEISMDENEARLAKNNLFVIMAGKLIPPYYSLTKLIGNERTYKIIKTTENINFSPECAIIFNGAIHKSYGPINFNRKSKY